MATGAKQDMHWWKKICVLSYHVLFDYSFQKRESNLIRITQWNILVFQCDVGCIPLSACLWHAKKDIIYAWIVDRLTWTSTTRALETFGKFPRKHPWSFLCKTAWNFTKKMTLLRVFPILGNIWKWMTFNRLGGLLFTYFNFSP